IDQEAGHFFRRYARNKHFSSSFTSAAPDSFNSFLKEIEMIGVPLAVGQAKLLGDYLKEAIDMEMLASPEKTAVVLSDEQMLFPVLHSLSEEFAEVNITMGYPLRDTPLYGFIEHLLDLQQNARENSSRGTLSFYHGNVLRLLKHPYFSRFNAGLSHELIESIEKVNKVYINDADLHQDYFYRA